MAKRAEDMGRPEVFDPSLVKLVEEMFDNWLDEQPKYQTRYSPSDPDGPGSSSTYTSATAILLSRLLSLRPADLEELARRYREAGWVVVGERSWSESGTFTGTFVLLHDRLAERETTLGDYQNMQQPSESLPGTIG